MSSILLKNKKILIIAYYWPPYSGVAVHRWLHMSNYLDKLGYEVHVLVPENANYSELDADLDKYVSKNINVVKTKIFEVRNLLSRHKKYKSNSGKLDSIFLKDKSKLSFTEKLMLWVRGNIFIPDARVTWFLKSKSAITKYVKENSIDVVITTGTPHSTHLFGLREQKVNNIKWIADFRDPWTAIEYHNEMFLSKFASKRHVNLERKVLTSADAVATVSHSWGEDFKKIGARKVFIVHNGYEENAFNKIKEKSSRDFTICHPGTLNNDRVPHNLFKCILELKNEGINIYLNLYGSVTNEIKSIIKELKLESNVKIFSSVSHNEILGIMKSSSLLLLLINKSKINSEGRIPAKIFEYFRCNKPILSLGNTEGDAARLIRKENAGKSFSYEDKDKVKEYLLRAFNSFINQDGFCVEVSYSKFSRQAMANKFSSIIQAV